MQELPYINFIKLNLCSILSHQFHIKGVKIVQQYQSDIDK